MSWAPGLLALSALSVTHEQGKQVSNDAALTEEKVQVPKKGPKTWLSLFNVREKSPPGLAVAIKGQPQTIAEVADIVAANTPVFFFHNEEQYASCLHPRPARRDGCKIMIRSHKHHLHELMAFQQPVIYLLVLAPKRQTGRCCFKQRCIACRYFPCTVEWFLERCRLNRVAMGWKRRVLETMVEYGMLDSKSLAEQQHSFDGRKAKRPRQFLQLQLEPSARRGQPVELNKVCQFFILQGRDVQDVFRWLFRKPWLNSYCSSASEFPPPFHMTGNILAQRL